MRARPPVRRVIAAVAAVVGIAVGLAVVVVATTPPTTDFVKIGDPAPVLRGTTLDGNAFDLASLRGRPVVVNFWASWCVPCRDEFPLFESAEKAHAGQGLAIIGVIFKDNDDLARGFIRQFGADWPSVSDPGNAIATAYRVVNPPQTYFIDRQGIVRKIQYGELSAAILDPQLAAILP